MDFKQRILEAAAKVYAEVGYRGATTRRIAAEAGCNELTLFRNFGSKATLIHEAVNCCGPELKLVPLPEVPVDPATEVRAWAAQHFENIRTHAGMIRTTLAEIEEHPELVRPSDPYAMAYEQLAAYVARLQASGRAEPTLDPMAAAAMLLNALLLNGILRDVMPHVILNSPEHDLDNFVRVFLRGIGAPVPVQA
jgi:AcrR family transcriptional regulator